MCFDANFSSFFFFAGAFFGRVDVYLKVTFANQQRRKTFLARNESKAPNAAFGANIPKRARILRVGTFWRFSRPEPSMYCKVIIRDE